MLIKTMDTRIKKYEFPIVLEQTLMMLLRQLLSFTDKPLNQLMNNDVNKHKTGRQNAGWVNTHQKS